MVGREITTLREVSSDDLSAGKMVDGTPLPPIPIPASPNDKPPKYSERIVVSTNPTQKLLLWWDYDHGDVQYWIPNVVGAEFAGIPSSTINYFYGPPIPDYTLTYRRYWQQLDYQAMDPGTGYTANEEISQGISTTNQQSLSGELGVDVGGLSAKLEATFTESITVTTETTVTKSWTVAASPPNTLTVWVLWQLVDEIVALGSDGHPVGGWPYGTCGANITPVPLAAMNGDTSLPSGSVAMPTRSYHQKITSFPTKP